MCGCVLVISRSLHIHCIRNVHNLYELVECKMEKKLNKRVNNTFTYSQLQSQFGQGKFFGHLHTYILRIESLEAYKY